MNKHLNEIIKNSKPYELGKPLSEIYIISTGKPYCSFWGETPYSGIIIIGKNDRYEDFYNVTQGYGVNALKIDIDDEFYYLDIPKDMNCVHIMFKESVCFVEILPTMKVFSYRNWRHNNE